MELIKAIILVKKRYFSIFTFVSHLLTSRVPVSNLWISDTFVWGFWYEKVTRREFRQILEKNTEVLRLTLERVYPEIQLENITILASPGSLNAQTKVQLPFCSIH